MKKVISLILWLLKNSKESDKINAMYNLIEKDQKKVTLEVNINTQERDKMIASIDLEAIKRKSQMLKQRRNLI